jgi:transcriptional regulator with XRE-family HTH domain
MDVRLFIKQRLEQLGFEQRDLASAVQVTESYISQLLTRKKAPPAADRTDLYHRMNAFLKLPKGQLLAMVAAQRKEELKKQLADPPAPLFKQVRELIVRKCNSERRTLVREILEKQAFGELERLVTQKLLDVSKRVTKDELGNEDWLRSAAERRNRSYEQMRADILEFLDTDVFDISPADCSTFLEPLIESWDIDLKTFAMEIVLNRRLASPQLVNFSFLEVRSEGQLAEEPGFQEFLGNPAMSADATEEEVEFLKSLRFKDHRPTPLYYYRELQSLRDPLHFGQSAALPTYKRRDAGELEKKQQLDSRKRAIHRWAKNTVHPPKKTGRRRSPAPARRSGRTHIN